jgi:hypothetical protein
MVKAVLFLSILLKFGYGLQFRPPHLPGSKVVDWIEHPSKHRAVHLFFPGNPFFLDKKLTVN